MFAFSPQTILGVPSIICPATTGATLLLLGSVCNGWEGTQVKLFFGATSASITDHITNLSASLSFKSSARVLVVLQVT